MKVVMACDHRGYDAKCKLLPLVKKLGHEVDDMGCHSPASVDYPDFAGPAARAVASGQYDVGILLDHSGIGMSIVANKIPGVRAALAHDEVTARIAREHNHCNMLCLGVDLISEEQVRKITELFLIGELAGGRHIRRVEKVAALERSLRETP